MSLENIFQKNLVLYSGDLGVQMHPFNLYNVQKDSSEGNRYEAMLPPWMIDQIKKQEEKKRKEEDKREQPRVYEIDIDHIPPEELEKIQNEKTKKKDDENRGVWIYDIPKGYTEIKDLN